MNALYTNWKFQLFNSRTGNQIDDDTGKLQVMTAGSPVVPTIYSDDRGTVGSSPLTFTNGLVEFWTVNTITSLDISILTAAGDAILLAGTTPGLTRVTVDVSSREQLLVIPWLFLAGGTVVDTGLDMPANMLVEFAGVRVTAIDAGETIDFGTLAGEAGGDENGFITLASIATLGMVELEPQITGGTNIDYVGTNYVGVLLCTTIAGADAVATVGGYTRKRYRTDGTAKSLVYTPSSSDTGRGYLYLGYKKLV